MVKSPTLERWFVMTLGWILAAPEVLTVSTLPEILQLVPELPTSPEEVVMDKCCEKAFNEVIIRMTEIKNLLNIA
jgi:hypothetical protein